MAVKIERNRLGALLSALGLKAWQKKGDAWMQLKIKKIQDMDTESIDGEEKETLDEVIAAVEGREKIEIVDSEDEEEEDEDEEGDEDEDEAPKKGKASANGKKGKDKDKKGGKKGKEKGPAKPGVIQTILECLRAASKTKPVTKDEIHKRLVKSFPDRKPDALKSTLSSQVPSGLRTEKNIEVTRVEMKGGKVGYYLDK
jgi:hypothetical protein